jgi:hypothetical protein
MMYAQDFASGANPPIDGEGLPPNPAQKKSGGMH